MYAQVLTALLLFIFPLSILPFQGTAFSLTSLLTLSAPAAVPGLKGPHIIIVTCTVTGTSWLWPWLWPGSGDLWGTGWGTAREEEVGGPVSGPRARDQTLPRGAFSVPHGAPAFLKPSVSTLRFLGCHLLFSPSLSLTQALMVRVPCAFESRYF